MLWLESTRGFVILGIYLSKLSLNVLIRPHWESELAGIYLLKTGYKESSFKESDLFLKDLFMCREKLNSSGTCFKIYSYVTNVSH